MGSACSSDNGGKESPQTHHSAAAKKYDATTAVNTTKPPSRNESPQPTPGGGDTATPSPKAQHQPQHQQPQPPQHHARGPTRGGSIDVVSSNDPAPAGAVGGVGAVGVDDVVDENDSNVFTSIPSEPPAGSVLNVPGAPPVEEKPRKLDKSQIEKLKSSTIKLSIFGECLNLEQQTYLASFCEIKKWNKIGDRICQQNHKAECMYIVHKGEVLLEVQDHALDNRPNQLQVARILAEQDLIPLTDENGLPIDPNTIPKSPNKSKSGTRHLPSELHPSSQAHSAPTHPRRLSGGGGGTHHMHTRGSNALTRAELIAIEAATMIQQETQAANGGAGTGTLGVDVDSPHVGVGGDGHISRLPSTVTPSLHLPPRPVTPPSPSTREAINDPEFAHLVAHLPETYSGANTMYMCVKIPTQTFGVGMFFQSQGRYMYSAINNSLSTHLIVMPRTAFDELWKRWPDTRGPIMKHLGEFLEDSLTQTRWLRDPGVVTPSKLTLLTSLFHHVSIEEGHTILFEEGDLTNDESPLYFILEGSVELTFTNEKGHKITKLLSKGSIFGELGVLLGFSITASAMTLEKCIFRLCKRRWLNLFTMMCPMLLPTLRSGITTNYHIRDEQLLENSQIQSMFMEFCLEKFCGENVEFYSAAIRFRKIIAPNSSSFDDLSTEAAMIYNRYISETSVLQINIKEVVRQTIRESLQIGEITKDLFLSAEIEIRQLMLQDTFTRFKATPLYTQALNMLHSPAPLPILLNHVNTMKHTIRTKEYSRTGEKTTTTGGTGIGARRALSLDDNSDVNAVPLMFGGSKRPAGTPVGVAHHHHANSSSGGANLAQPKATHASAGVGLTIMTTTPPPHQTSQHHQQQHQPSLAVASNATHNDSNPLATPVATPLAVPVDSEGGLLRLSPGSDRFRLVNAPESPAPTRVAVVREVE